MKCIVCERELSSKKEGLYIKHFKGNWCHVCISQSISFEISKSNLGMWIPQEYLDKGVRMEKYYLMSAIGKLSPETLEDRETLDNANWALSSNIIGDYVQKKYGMEYLDFLMLLDKRKSSDQFIYTGNPKSKHFTRESSYFNRRMTVHWGHYEECLEFVYRLEKRSEFLEAYEEYKKTAAE